MEYQPKKLITRILEYAGLIALSAFLVRLAVGCILEIWPVLLVIFVIAVGSVIGYRIWRNRSRW